MYTHTPTHLSVDFAFTYMIMCKLGPQSMRGCACVCVCAHAYKFLHVSILPLYVQNLFS